MKLDVKNIRLAEAQLPLLLIGLTEEAMEKGANLKLTGAMKKMAQGVIELGDFKATRGEHSLLYSIGKIKSERIMLLGLGKRAEITSDQLRATLGGASRVIRDLGVEKLGVSLHTLTQGELSEESAAEIVAEAFIMGSFSDPFHKTKDLDKFKAIKELREYRPRLMNYYGERLGTGAKPYKGPRAANINPLSSMAASFMIGLTQNPYTPA